MYKSFRVRVRVFISAGLCKDEKHKFKRLEKYFVDLEVVDVLQLEDPLQLVKDAEPADRFPMRLFLEKYIIPLLEVNYQHQNDPKLITLDDNQVGVIASRVLISNMFESLNNNKMTIAGFYQWVNEQNQRSIRYLDMSANELLSTDVKVVFKLIQLLENDGLLSPNGLIVNLRCNRIHGIQQYQKEVDEYMEKLLVHPKIEFVDIRVNPFASVDRKDFFQNPIRCWPMKLIWIDEIHLNSKGWKNMIPSEDEALVDTVVKAHQQYFAWMKKYVKVFL